MTCLSEDSLLPYMACYNVLPCLHESFNTARGLASASAFTGAAEQHPGAADSSWRALQSDAKANADRRWLRQREAEVAPRAGCGGRRAQAHAAELARQLAATNTVLKVRSAARLYAQCCSYQACHASCSLRQDTLSVARIGSK